jgi:nondiscriminating glutamyl-tRNA synthetase
LGQGGAYPCYCTPAELEEGRAALRSRGEAPRYDGRCRNLSEPERNAREREGRRVAVRFRLEAAGETAWDDVVRGRVAFQNTNLDDFVLLRSDGHPTYNFACVVDDHEMEISDVIRGDDHISNTPRQLLLYQAFGWEPPRFAHVPMILGADGTRLSKRHGATSVAAYRELGYLPSALNNFLALLGWSFDGKQEIFSMAELEQLFQLERVGSNPAVFNLEKLDWINAQHLKRLSEDERVRLVAEYLATRGIGFAERGQEWCTSFVRAIGDRFKTLADAERYGGFALTPGLEMDEQARNELRDRPEVAARLEALAQRLEQDPEFTMESLERESRRLAAELGIRAGELISIARIGLTGRTVSPGIFEVMCLLGRERAVARLREAGLRWREETQLGRVAE